MSAPTRTQHPDIPDVLTSRPSVPPSRRYGAADDRKPQPWSRLIDVLAGIGLFVAMVEEFVDYFASDESLHFVMAVAVGAALWVYALRVGTRDLQ